jgi:hypothetical protein
MHRCKRLVQLLSLTVLGLTTAAFAEETSQMPPPADSANAAPAAAAEPGAAPAAEPGAEPAVEETPAVSATAVAAAKAATAPHYGLALRWRYISVPGWFLGLFTTKNVPLSTFNCFALEGFWRSHDKEDRNRTWEIVVAVGYQNMSVPDGYWLGKGKDINMDTDLVQAKGFGLITMDAAYVLRQYFSPYFGIHYGAGLGLGVVRGKIMRTSATCDATGQCHVEISKSEAPAVNCGHSGEPVCTEQDLQNSQYQPDTGPGGARRFQENSIPSAIPIINLLFGLDFPIPDAKGLEFRIEGGFYDAFFIGLTGGYVF